MQIASKVSAIGMHKGGGKRGGRWLGGLLGFERAEGAAAAAAAKIDKRAS